MAPDLEKAVISKLISRGCVERSRIRDIASGARAGGEGGLLERIVREHLVPAEIVSECIAEVSGLPYRALTAEDVDPEAVDMIPASLAEKYRLLPVRMANGGLLVALSLPLARDVVVNIERMLGRRLEFCIASSEAIGAILSTFHRGAVAVEGGIEGTRDSVVSILDELIVGAIRERASDIHVESAEDRVRIRCRVDGVLRETGGFPKSIMAPLVSRIKVLSQMDIAEKRMPQDGSFKFQWAQESLDIRVSVLPNIYGEKAVLRLLPSRRDTRELGELGMSGAILERFSPFLLRPHGMILVTGPTGSGKSTTLYAVLSRLRSAQSNITTVEDPVEYHLSGATQVQVDMVGKVTFSTVLRSILRQDPDIIMVGEIRDRETADLALRAALTGHLVFSTLHTKNAGTSITRLLDMGCEPHIVASSVTAVLAQRLVRVICENCKEAMSPDEKAQYAPLVPKEYGHLPFYTGRGCARCRRTGYFGRVGVFELLVVDEALRRMIVRKASAEEIATLSISRGMGTMTGDGFEKMAKGITTIEEVLRVTAADEVVLPA